jgi:hypothetical protein
VIKKSSFASDDVGIEFLFYPDRFVANRAFASIALDAPFCHISGHCGIFLALSASASTRLFCRHV